jgi:hypothetical protein
VIGCEVNPVMVLSLLPDQFLQFTAEAFELPRSDMPPTVRFAGPILPKRAVVFEVPSWWNEFRCRSAGGSADSGHAGE